MARKYRIYTKKHEETKSKQKNPAATSKTQQQQQKQQQLQDFVRNVFNVYSLTEREVTDEIFDSLH